MKPDLLLLPDISEPLVIKGEEAIMLEYEYLCLSLINQNELCYWCMLGKDINM